MIHYGSLNLEAIHMSTFPGISGIVDGGDILGLLRENELEVSNSFLTVRLYYLQLKLIISKDWLSTKS